MLKIKNLSKLYQYKRVLLLFGIIGVNISFSAELSKAQTPSQAASGATSGSASGQITRRAPANTVTALANSSDQVSGPEAEVVKTPNQAQQVPSGVQRTNSPNSQGYPVRMVPASYNQRIAILGSEILFLKSTASMGILYGWKYLSFESESFGIGGAGYTGQMSGGQSGSFSFGGMVADFSGTLSRTIDIDFSILAGGGGGLLTSGTGEGGVVLSPSLGLTFILGKAVRTSVSGLYVYMPSAPSFTSFGGSMRFEFKLPQ